LSAAVAESDTRGGGCMGKREARDGKHGKKG